MSEDRNDELNYTPPEIPGSEFPVLEPGFYAIEVKSWQLQENGYCAWLRCASTDKRYTGTVSLNLYLPTKEQLNLKLKEKGGKEEALRSFFAWANTITALELSPGKSIKATLDAMIGHKAVASVITDSFGSKVDKLITPKAAKAKGQPEADEPNELPF